MNSNGGEIGWTGIRGFDSEKRINGFNYSQTCAWGTEENRIQHRQEFPTQSQFISVMVFVPFKMGSNREKRNEQERKALLAFLFLMLFLVFGKAVFKNARIAFIFRGIMKLAERGGFEPPVRLLTVQRFSKPPPSATRPSLQTN